MKLLRWIWVLSIILYLVIRSTTSETTHIDIESIQKPHMDFSETSLSFSSVDAVHDPVNHVFYTIDEFNQLELITFENFNGVGPVLAEAIYAYINESGGLNDFNELLEIKGIGPKKLEGILENSK